MDGKHAFRLQNAQALREEHILPLLVSYLYHIDYNSGSLKKKKDLMAATLKGYLLAATMWIRVFLHLQVNIRDESGKLNPMLDDIIAQRRAWQHPKAKCEPYTQEMFYTLATQLHQATKNDATVALGL
jgi:hypothetical protein